jgi:hypothetical protein
MLTEMVGRLPRKGWLGEVPGRREFECAVMSSGDCSAGHHMYLFTTVPSTDALCCVFASVPL